MEEKAKKSLISCFQQSEDSKSSPSAFKEIQDLHSLIQGYLDKVQTQNMLSTLPYFQQVSSELNLKKEQIQKLKQSQPQQQKRKQYACQNKKLGDKLKLLSKDIEKIKTKAKALRIQEKQIAQQLRKNKELLRELQDQSQKYSTKQYYDSQNNQNKSNKLIFPRISGFNYDLHHSSSKRMQIPSNTSRSSEKSQEEKQNYYNSLKFFRIKQMQKLFDQIEDIGGQSQQKFERLLVGDKRQSIVKRVFKKYSIKEYFDTFVHEKKVHSFLENIQKL